MKSIKYFFITVALLIQSIFSLQAQNTEGTEFWLTFGHSFTYSLSWVDIQIRIVGGSEKTTGNIYFTNLGTNSGFNIEPYEVFTYVFDNTEKVAVMNQTMGITNHSIYISTSKHVTVYAFIYMNSRCEAAIVLPVTALGTEYYQISYTESSSYYNDAYAVIATQNNTLLYHNSVPITTLNLGEVYYRNDSDMTGAYITSNKPVAFFALNKRAVIPSSGTSGNFGIPMEQMIPVNTWDKEFFVPVTVLEQDIVRIVVAQNGTNITQTGGTIRTGVPGAKTYLTNLQAGDFVELDINITNNGCYIAATKPVGVCTYTSQLGTHSQNKPSQCLMPGKRQVVSKAMIAPFVQNILGAPIETHYALIITSTDTKDGTKVSVGGAPPVPLSGIWYNNTTADMSFTSIPLYEATKSYVFTNPDGLIILGYGVGSAAASSPSPGISYYYLAGSAMRDLDAAFYANDIHFQDLKENPFCAGLVEFRTEINGLHPTATDKIRWFIDGAEQFALQNNILWNKSFSVGEYEIKMIVRYENDETASRIGTLKIVPCNYSAEFFANDIPHSLLQNNPICNKTGKVDFRAVIEGIHSEAGSLKWYVDGVKEDAADDQLTWNKTFATGTYEIKMWVRYDNGETAEIISTLKVEIFFLKIQNVRH